jgi:hypothetical protein
LWKNTFCGNIGGSGNVDFLLALIISILEHLGENRVIALIILGYTPRYSSSKYIETFNCLIQ